MNNVKYVRSLRGNMHKKLRQTGSSWNLLIPKSILDVTNINPVLDEVEIIVERDEIRIRKYKGKNS